MKKALTLGTSLVPVVVFGIKEGAPVFGGDGVDLIIDSCSG